MRTKTKLVQVTLITGLLIAQFIPCAHAWDNNYSQDNTYDSYSQNWQNYKQQNNINTQPAYQQSWWNSAINNIGNFFSGVTQAVTNFVSNVGNFFNNIVTSVQNFFVKTPDIKANQATAPPTKDINTEQTRGLDTGIDKSLSNKNNLSDTAQRDTYKTQTTQKDNPYAYLTAEKACYDPRAAGLSQFSSDYQAIEAEYAARDKWVASQQTQQNGEGKLADVAQSPLTSVSSASQITGQGSQPPVMPVQQPNQAIAKPNSDTAPIETITPLQMKPAQADVIPAGSREVQDTSLTFDNKQPGNNQGVQIDNMVKPKLDVSDTLKPQDTQFHLDTNKNELIGAVKTFVQNVGAVFKDAWQGIVSVKNNVLEFLGIGPQKNYGFEVRTPVKGVAVVDMKLDYFNTGEHPIQAIADFLTGGIFANIRWSNAVKQAAPEIAKLIDSGQYRLVYVPGVNTSGLDGKALQQITSNLDIKPTETYVLGHSAGTEAVDLSFKYTARTGSDVTYILASPRMAASTLASDMEKYNISPTKMFTLNAGGDFPHFADPELKVPEMSSDDSPLKLITTPVSLAWDNVSKFWHDYDANRDAGTHLYIAIGRNQEKLDHSIMVNGLGDNHKFDIIINGQETENDTTIWKAIDSLNQQQKYLRSN